MAAALFALAGLGAPKAADAQAYVSGSVGLFAPNDIGVSGSSLSGNLDLDNGVDVTAALGYRLPFNLRLEGEFGYAHTKVSKVTVAGTGSANLSGADINVY